MQRDDDSLMETFRDNDGDAGREAFDDLYRRYRPRIFAFHLAMTGNNATEAEERTQETFCRLIDKKSMYDRNRGTFSVWLYMLATYIKRDAVRRFKQAAIVALDGVMNTMFESSPVFLERLIAECIDELEAIDRQIILLTAIEGFTCMEASRILNMPPGTIGRRRSAALKTLHAAFSQPAMGTNVTNTGEEKA
jgi:RNA polymerase sigma factor (sigma-70 family)